MTPRQKAAEARRKKREAEKKRQQNKTKPSAIKTKTQGGKRSTPKSRRTSNSEVAKNNRALLKTGKNLVKGLAEAPARAVRSVNKTFEGMQQLGAGVEPSKLNANVRPIGTRNRAGKYWAGQSYGYQSKAQFDKLQKQGAFRGGDIALRRVGSDIAGGVDQRIKSGAGKAVDKAIDAGVDAYLNAPRPVQQAVETAGRGLQFVDDRLEDVSRATNTSRIISDAAVETVTAGAAKAVKAGLLSKKAAKSAARQSLKSGRIANTLKAPIEAIRSSRLTPRSVGAQGNPARAASNRSAQILSDAEAIRNRLPAVSQRVKRGPATANYVEPTRTTAPRTANTISTGGRTLRQDAPRALTPRERNVLRPRSAEVDAVRGPNLRRRDGVGPGSRIYNRAYSVDTARLPRSQATPNTVTRSGQRRGPAASRRSRNVGSDGSLRASELQTGEGPSIRRTDEAGSPFSGRSLASPVRVREAAQRARATPGNNRYPRAARTGENRLRTGRRDNTRRQRQRARNANEERRLRLSLQESRRNNRSPRLQEIQAERRANAQTMVASRNRLAGRTTQARVDNFRRENPTSGQQSVAALRARYGSDINRTTGRLQQRRADAVARMNRTGSEVGARNTGLRRRQPQNFETPNNPTIRAPRGNAPRLDGGRVRRAQLASARKEVARQQSAKKAAAAKKAMSSAAARQGTKTKQVVTKSTDLTKRGPKNPETGKRERLFTPENRAKALQKKGSEVKAGGSGEGPASYLDRDDRYISAGGRVTVGARYGDEFDMSFKSIDPRKRYASDDELKKNGFKVRSKSGVDKKLNMANVANQQGHMMLRVKTGEILTATPIDRRRANLYKRASNGALDFVETSPGRFEVASEKIGRNKWRTINGKEVEFDPRTLTERLDKLAGNNTNRRLLGRRVKDKTTGRNAGGSRAQLKTKSVKAPNPKAKKAIKGLANRQGSGTVTTKVTRNDLSAPKQGKDGDRLFTPANRVAAAQRATSKAKRSKSANGVLSDSSIESGFAGRNAYGDKDVFNDTTTTIVSVGRPNKDGTTRFTQQAQKNLSSFNKEVRSKATQNALASILENVSDGEFIKGEFFNADGKGKGRNKIFAKITNQLMAADKDLNFKARRDFGEFWTNELTGEMVEFDPEKLRNGLNQLRQIVKPETRLVGRRLKLGGKLNTGTRAKLKVKTNRR